MKKLINYYVSEKNTILEAMSVIQSNLSRCVIVFNKNNKVSGIFTEGDVLRVILNGTNVNIPLKEVIKDSFYYLEEVDMEKAYKLIKKHGVVLIPVVTKDFTLKDVITISDILDWVELPDKND